jgi:serine/threonine-protein kinase
MQLYCTRPGCSRPVNPFPDLDDPNTIKTIQQKYCTNCGMPLILVGRYLPTKLLGQGGFGAAFLGRDRYTPGLRQCVIKQFQPSGNLTPTQLQRAQNLFEREAEVLEQLGREHPQIPDLFAFFELTVPNAHTQKDDKFFYLVQEFIDGATLEEELAQKGKFVDREILDILQQILKVLEFVHENGSIHRDIKPSNIIRNRAGKLYLLDFGAVRYVTKVVGNTQGSTGIYSPGYAPPEQMSGGQIFPSSDLYALAVTCISLLTGKHPNDLFDSFSNSWTWKNDAHPSPELAEVLDRMLMHAPSDRFQSATEVLDALTPKPPPIVPSPAAPPAPLQPAPPPRRRFALPRFSTLEILNRALFTGFEAGLMAIGMVSLLGTTWLSASFWIVLVGILLVAQMLRVIEKVDFLILGGISLAIVGFVRQLNWSLMFLRLESTFINVLLIAGLTGLTVLAIAILFQLIYKLVSRIL